MKKIVSYLAIGAAVLFAGYANADVPLQQPTFHQVDPVPYCTNGETLVAASATGINGAYLTGKAQVNGFYCKPRIGYTHIYSACANVVWDFNGAIVSVTPTAANTRSTIVCP